MNCSVNAPGTAQTKFSGIQNFTTDFLQGQYRLRESRNGVDFKTLNATGLQSELDVINNSTDFYDNDNNWTSQETGLFNVATDVHWGMEKTYDYWLSKHNRNSVNNAGQYNSIFYTGGYISFSSPTSLDITAHEFGHGVCIYTSDLQLYSGTESQALCEGFSDIWGACVEAHAAPNKQRWLIAEDAVIVSPHYLRSMSNPPSGLIYPPYTAPPSDTYGDANWNAVTDGHFRCGVIDKWFYLLTEGGSGTNGIGNSYNVYGITMAKSEKIAYRTEQLLQSNANYAMARTMSIQAAQEIFGTNSCEVKAVTDAWYAVGVGAAYIGAVPFTNTFGISGTYTNNGNNAKITYKVIPNFQFAYRWYVNGILQSSNTNECVTTSFRYDCNSSSSPQWLDNNIVSVVICGNTFTCNPIVSICGTAPDPSIRGRINCGFNIAINPPPCCIVYKTNSMINNSDNFNIFPNPTFGEFIINSQDFKKAVKKVIIKNKMGMIVYEEVFTNYQNQQNIYLSGKQADIYFVEIFDGDSWTIKKINLLH